ncbi:MAG: ABC transporter permease [Oscillospiraceae bacterium]|nr:ABC transporter permease [Oscillospiraceae bacterium]
MGRYILKRLLLMIPILLGICLIVLILIDVTPGDPARIVAGATATPEQYAKVREDLQLDRTFIERYFSFLGGVLKGSFGTSFITKTDVWRDMAIRFPYTLRLAFSSVILSVIIGVPLGMMAAVNQNTWKDYLAILFSLLCSAMPAFWLALLLVQWFAVNLRWVPVSGISPWTAWILPILSLALGYAAGTARLMRSTTLEVIRQDYIVTARAKGLGQRKVLFRHVLKNSLIPIIVSVGSMFGMSLGGSLITETIFSIPGLGQYTLTGLTNRDYPVIQGSVLFLSTMFSIVILLIDIVFAFVDPRIRSQYMRAKKTKKTNDEKKEKVPEGGAA